MARFDLTDREWSIISPLLLNKPRGVARTDDRAGAQRHHLHPAHQLAVARPAGSPGLYTAAYNRYNRWAKAGIWLRSFEALAARSPQSLQCIDSSRSCGPTSNAAGGIKRGWITPLAVLVED